MAAHAAAQGAAPPGAGQGLRVCIDWRTDVHDCDTCGPSYASGAVVTFEGLPDLDLSPSAACYDGASYGRDEVFRKILERLGHDVAYAPPADGDPEEAERLLVDGRPVPELAAGGDEAVGRALERLGYEVSQSCTEFGEEDPWDE